MKIERAIVLQVTEYFYKLRHISTPLGCCFESYLGSVSHLVKGYVSLCSRFLLRFQTGFRTRSLSRSKPARPYICRLSSFSRWM